VEVRVEDDRSREDQWFAQNEKLLLEAAKVEREKRERERAAAGEQEERQKLRDLHHMRCPKCGQAMVEEPLQGIRIDRCTSCEGIFFDAGELDQVMLQKDADRRGFFRKLVKI
jgi:uncharacterized protein